jgi:hypothetical protein
MKGTNGSRYHPNSDTTKKCQHSLNITVITGSAYFVSTDHLGSDLQQSALDGSLSRRAPLSYSYDCLLLFVINTL